LDGQQPQPPGPPNRAKWVGEKTHKIAEKPLWRMNQTLPDPLKIDSDLASPLNKRSKLALKKEERKLTVLSLFPNQIIT
jgi:hypothetical protein